MKIKNTNQFINCVANFVNPALFGKMMAINIKEGLNKTVQSRLSFSIQYGYMMF